MDYNAQTDTLRGSVIIFPRPGKWQGIWIQSAVPLSPRKNQTLIEMVAGAVALKSTGSDSEWAQAARAGVKIADEKQWQFLIGMVVCEVAHKMEI